MSSKGRRYDQERKLNIKKVIAVIVAIAVVIMFIVGIKTLLTTEIPQPENKQTESRKELSYYPVYTNKKWGVINEEGEIVIEPTYEEMITIPSPKTDVFVCVYDVDYKNNTYKTKVLDSKNNEIFTDYDLVEVIENIDDNNNLWYEQGILKVKKDNKYGLIGYSGEIILPLEYDNIEALQGMNDRIIIEKDGKKGICDNSGNIILELSSGEIDKTKVTPSSEENNENNEIIETIGKWHISKDRNAYYYTDE